MDSLRVYIAIVVVMLALLTSSTPVVAQETVDSVVMWPCESRFVTAMPPAETPQVQMRAPEKAVGGLMWPCESRFVTAMPHVETPQVQMRAPEKAVGGLMWPCESRFVTAMPRVEIVEELVTGDPQANKALVRHLLSQYFAADGDDLLQQFYSADLVEARRQEWSVWKSAFPDLRFALDFQIAEGDRVMSCWTFQGTHTGEYMGLAPTGNEVTFQSIVAARIVDGKIVEEVGEVDRFGLVQQLGGFLP